MTILRDKCVLDSFVRMTLLPFSDEADTGQFFAYRGMGMVPIVPALLHSIPHNELVMAQLADLSSKRLSERVVLLKISVMLYFVLNGAFVRKWVPSSDNFVDEPIVQTVAPQKFRQLALKASHDSVAGHKGVKKAYTHILQKSLWPLFEKGCIKVHQNLPHVSSY